jgi:hypothetical protein
LKTRAWGNPIWGDLNNDGFLDLIVPIHELDYLGGPPTPFVYLNNKNGTFADISATAGLVRGEPDDSWQWSIHGDCWGENDETGIALVEVYDLDDSAVATAQLANISTRGFVGPRDNVMIGGFIIGPPAEVLLRAIGPSLAGAGIPVPLENPMLELHDTEGATIASNDNWADTDESAIQATGLAPTNADESAILANCPRGVTPPSFAEQAIRQA